MAEPSRHLVKWALSCSPLDIFPIWEVESFPRWEAPRKMQVLGLLKLDAAKRAHADSRGQFDAWLQEARAASWATPQDIRDRFASASFLAENRVVFNIKGNAFRLVVKVNYPAGIILVEWAGTHAEYDKQSF